MMFGMYAVGHISGAHFGAAVTFAFALTRHFPWPRALAYWGAQFVGALCAAALLRASLVLPWWRTGRKVLGRANIGSPDGESISSLTGIGRTGCVSSSVSRSSVTSRHPLTRYELLPNRWWRARRLRRGALPPRRRHLPAARCSRSRASSRVNRRDVAFTLVCEPEEIPDPTRGGRSLAPGVSWTVACSSPESEISVTGARLARLLLA